MTTVSLGVVAYRDPGSLDRLLASAAGFDEILVANVSADRAVEAVCARHGAVHLPLEGNPGYAAGVGALARAATGDHLLFTNDDVRFAVGFGDRVRHATRPGTVVIPRVVDTEGRTTTIVKALPTPTRVLVEWILLPDAGPPHRGVQKWRRPERVETIEAATAAAVLVERRLLLDHPMPTDYVLYWEELSWFWDLDDAAIPVVYDPTIRVERQGGRAEIGLTKWRYLGANLVRLGSERYGRAGRYGYALLAVLWLARLALTDGLRADRRLRWRARLAGLHGVGAAVAGRA